MSDNQNDSLEMKFLSVDLVEPNEFNPQAMSKNEFERLKQEISETGFIAPIQVVPLDSGKFMILGGEHRWSAAKALGMDKIPCAILKGKKWQEEDLCFIGGTRIETPSGGKPIELLAAGDEIFSGEGTPVKVIATSKRKYTGKMVKVFFEANIEPLTGTYDHPMLIHTSAGTQIKKLGELTPQDYLFTPIFSDVYTSKDVHLHGNKSVPQADTKVKRLPSEVVFSSDYKVREEALMGLLDGDGHRGKKANKITTTSIELAYQICWLLQSTGHSYGVSKNTRRPNTAWNVSWGLKGTYSKRKLKEGKMLRKVRKIETEEMTTEVFNLETEAPNTYIANGVAVHNCKLVTVRLNTISGKLDPEKFSKLYEEMATKYGAESLQTLFGFSDANALAKALGGLKDSLKKALPKAMHGAIDAAAKEAKSIQDLSSIVQHLFQKYGDTVIDLSFMVFAYNKSNHIYITMSKDMRKSMDKVLNYCQKTKQDINVVLAPMIDEWAKTAESKDTTPAVVDDETPDF